MNKDIQLSEDEQNQLKQIRDAGASVVDMTCKILMKGFEDNRIIVAMEDIILKDKERIATLEAQLRWIPVGEGNLPAINVKVEVKCAGGGVAIGRTTLQSTAKFPFFYFFDVYDIESEWNERIWTAVAWRPIPELPNPPEEKA
jgi:hypothetical protein